MVEPVKRLYDDLKCLNDFFAPAVPPWKFVRGNIIYVARYGFGDASKSGFGSTIETNEGIAYIYGT